MEPITTAWMMTALLSGWLGNRGDYWLSKGSNGIYNRIKSNLNGSANLHIQRAIRKLYVKATLMAVDPIQKQRSRFSLIDKSWRNRDELKSYLNEQFSNTNKEGSYIRSSDLNTFHQKILFPNPGAKQFELLNHELVEKLDIYGRDGALVRSIYLPSKNIDVGNLKGIYLTSIIFKKGTTLKQKLLIQ